MEKEVTLLVAAQMVFCVLGVFINNVAFITLKDMPGVRASTYNILLCHIVLGTEMTMGSSEKMVAFPNSNTLISQS